MFGRKERGIVHVLVVEDEPLVAFDTEHFLRGEGYEIVGTVDTVGDALAVLAAAEVVDLVLADVNLSDGSGVDVARAAHGRGIHVIYVTGSTPDEARAFAAGCLSKPYQQRDLLAAIRAVDRVAGGGKVPKRLPTCFSLFLEAAA